MSSHNPCECEEPTPGYGGECKACGRECFSKDEEPPNDYRCRECKELVLYRSDHKHDCMYYPKDLPFIGRLS